jgi:prepilin-type N-terminal cleavage/methylation domain-containing protein
MRAFSSGPASHRGRAGFTFIELAVVLIILLVALLIFSNTINGMARQRAVNRESSIAMEAARNQVESLRGSDYRQIFALFNSDPDDDPEGPGTAPGHRFLVAPLSPPPESEDGLQGEIFFPAGLDPTDGLELREDVELTELGMPRDLNGDSIIDDLDHSGDYFILPVLVRIRWTGKTGLREYELTTQICKFVKV